MPARLLYGLGKAVRETGQALERLGASLQGNFAWREELNRARPLQNLGARAPAVGEGAFVAPSASVVGDVALGPRASVFYGAVLRGDAGALRVGAGTNIQDGAVVCTGAPGGGRADTTLGARVTVGHAASVGGGCAVGDGALVGMGAALLGGARVEPGGMVAAGAVVPPGAVVPSGEIWGGNPARLLRRLRPEEAAFLGESAEHYVRVAAEHLKTANLSPLEVARQKGQAAAA